MADNHAGKARAMLSRCGYASGGALSGASARLKAAAQQKVVGASPPQALAKGGKVRGKHHVSVNILMPQGGGGAPPPRPVPVPIPVGTGGPPGAGGPPLGLARPPGAAPPGAGMPPVGPPPGLAGGIPPGLRPGMKRGGGVKRAEGGGINSTLRPTRDVDEDFRKYPRQTEPPPRLEPIRDRSDTEKRARGGRTGYPLDDGSGGGSGRREKIAAYGAGKR